jgi:thiamine biosynthesis protein ThiI
LNFNNSATLFDFVIVRLGGEIGIKSAWTRRAYEKRLIRNIKATLKHHDIPYEAVVRQQGRIYIKTSQAQKAALKLTKVFGISSLSPASQTTSRLEDITTRAILLAKQKLERRSSFAVRCKRVGTHPYTSRDLCKHIGQKILEAFPELQPKVDLASPDITIGIEIRENIAYIYTQTLSAPDGLPVGTQPKVIALMEPDLNSPVACWLTMKRGCPIVPAHFSEDQSKTATKQVEDICGALYEWSIGHPKRLYLVPHSQSLAILKQKCPAHLLEVINKRLIYRITARIAQREGAEAIVTGETLGERPHQTLRCLRLQDQATSDYPIHRPLIGLDDAEIRRLVQIIGISRLSVTETRKREAVKPRETTLPTLRKVKAAESKLNLQEMIDAATQQIEILTL